MLAPSRSLAILLLMAFSLGSFPAAAAPSAPALLFSQNQPSSTESLAQEPIGYQATITFETGEHAQNWLADLTPVQAWSLAAVAALIIFATASLIALLLRRTRRMEKALLEMKGETDRLIAHASGQSTDQAFAVSKTVPVLIDALCEKNQLVRVTAIYQLSHKAKQDERQIPRIATLLAAYLRAISVDESLRQAAKAEMLACLQELSTLNQLYQDTQGGPLMLELQKVNLSGLTLKDLNLNGFNLSGSNFQGTAFYNVTLQRARLDKADFSDVTWTDVNATGTTFTGVTWTNIALHNVKGVNQEEIQMSKEINSTIRDKAKVNLLESGKRHSKMELSAEIVPLDKSKLH